MLRAVCEQLMEPLNFVECLWISIKNVQIYTYNYKLSDIFYMQLLARNTSKTFKLNANLLDKLVHKLKTTNPTFEILIEN